MPMRLVFSHGAPIEAGAVAPGDEERQQEAWREVGFLDESGVGGKNTANQACAGLRRERRVEWREQTSWGTGERKWRVQRWLAGGAQTR